MVYLNSLKNIKKLKVMESKKKFLDESQIHEKTVVMIDFDSGNSVPFFVVQKKPGEIPGSTLLIGDKITKLIESPKCYTKIPNKKMLRLYAKGEPNRINIGVDGFRRINEAEKRNLIDKIKTIIELNPLIEIIEVS